MKTFYTLGIFTATFLLIQIDVLLIMITYFLFSVTGVEVIAQLACLAVAVILILGHAISTFQSLNHLQDKSIDFDTILEEKSNKNEFLNNPFALGVLFRIIKEIKNIKRVAQLKFKEEN